MVKGRTVRKLFKQRVVNKFNKYSHKKIMNKPFIHYFKRTVLTSYTVSNTAFQNAVVQNTFKLNDLPNYTEFTALYDSYKINAIKVKFIFDRNSADSQAGLATQTLPNLLTIKDYNDATAPADENTMLQYPTFKVQRLDRPISRYFKPCQALDDTAKGIVKSRWNPTDEPDVPHRGLKACIAMPTTVNDDVGKLKIYTTYYLAMRTPK